VEEGFLQPTQKNTILELTPEELIMDRDFVAWILHGQNHERWEHFLNVNPGFESTSLKARQMIELLNDRADHLSETDILAIRQKIEHFEQQYLMQPRKRKIQLLLKFAAMFIVMVSIGTAGFWMFNQNQPVYQFTSTTESGADLESRLFLSNGTTVPLEKDNSKIALTSDQQILINNDQVIDISKTNPQDESKMNEVVIPFGRRSQLVLEDGTKVWLNAGSRFAFPTKFTGKKREVFLEGEAYFEVAKNIHMPFFVNTAQIAVKVLGTKFNISAYLSESSIETVLLEGKVSLNEPSSLGFLKNETILSPHQRASYNKSQNIFQVKDEPDVEYVIAWTEGWFKYSHENLSDVLRKLERYYNVKFIFESKLPSDVILTGKLDLKESIENVLIALGDVANIQCRIKDQEIFIEKKIDKINMRK